MEHISRRAADSVASSRDIDLTVASMSIVVLCATPSIDERSRPPLRINFLRYRDTASLIRRCSKKYLCTTSCAESPYSSASALALPRRLASLLTVTTAPPGRSGALGATPSPWRSGRVAAGSCLSLRSRTSSPARAAVRRPRPSSSRPKGRRCYVLCHTDGGAYPSGTSRRRRRARTDPNSHGGSGSRGTP